ncbi:MAG: DUF1272 domain-containing protein [Exilibacterium sp.]
MLELRPNCEGCDKDLPPESIEAFICTYECTFCVNCVNDLLMNVCPNCGGGFSPRPIRPKKERRVGVSLSHQPASTSRVNTKYTAAEIAEFSHSIQAIKPENR